VLTDRIWNNILARGFTIMGDKSDESDVYFPLSTNSGWRRSWDCAVGEMATVQKFQRRFAVLLAALLTIAVLAWLSKSLFQGEQSLAKQKRSARDLASMARVLRGRSIEAPDIYQAFNRSPQYRRDAWGRPIGVLVRKDIEARQRQWCIFSKGADGALDARWPPGSFRYSDYDRDLVICDGEWLTWPAWPGGESQPPEIR
jgi:hypothetical protein